jgi:transcriptional regulator GlxA family with amidase domain
LEVARVLVVFLRRPGNQAQFSVSLGTQTLERNPLRELRVWMAEHLTAQIETARRLLERTMQSMDEIADCCGFGSADVLARAFTRVLRVTPGEYRSRFRSSGIEK